MNSKSVKQIEEFSELWHNLIRKSHYDSIENQFPNIRDLSTAEISIISMVFKKPDIILGEICSAIDIPKSTLTNMINRLEKRDYIKRRISERDKRSYGLELTEKGQLAQKEHVEFEHTVFGGMLNMLDSDEERQILIELIRKIANNIEKNKGINTL